MRWRPRGSARKARLNRLVVACLAVALTAAVPAAERPVGAAAPKLPRFPAASWNRAIGPTHLSSPVIADVNGDGIPDIVTADLSGWVHVLSVRNGKDLPGWPQPVQVIPGRTVAVESSPTVVDLAGDGKQDIIVGAGSLDVPNQQGGVVAFRANGSVLWRVQTKTRAGQNAVVDTPAVGDINGDGHRDVVFASFDHDIYAVNQYGQRLPGFPFLNLDTVWDSPALYDVGNIGRMDIFIGGDASPGGPCGQQTPSGILRRIRDTPTGPKVMWSYCQHQTFQSSPAIGDIGSDGRMDLVIGTGAGPGGSADSTDTLKAFHVDDGTMLPGWPVHLNGPIFGSPVIGDVNGDHRRDVVVAACAQCHDGRIWAFGGKGKLIWSVEPGAPEGDHTEMLSTPILVDLNGDGVNDVAMGFAGEFVFLGGRTGHRLFRPIEVGRVTQNSAAVAKFGRYGWKLVTQTWKPQGDGLPVHGAGKVSAYPLPRAPRTPAWPQWRQNGHHTAAPIPPLDSSGL